MTLEQIIDADEDYLERKVCHLFSLPKTVNKVQLDKLLRNGRIEVKSVKCNKSIINL